MSGTQYRTITGPNPGLGHKQYGVSVVWNFNGCTEMDVWFNSAEDRQDWLDEADVTIHDFLFNEMES